MDLQLTVRTRPLQLLDEVRAAGKYVIFNGIRYATSRATPTRPAIVRDDYDALHTLLPHASAGYHEPWLSGTYRNATTGKLDAARVTHGLLTFIVRTHNNTYTDIQFVRRPIV